MTVHYGYDNLKFRNPVVTTGVFDGVHRGHRFVLDMLKKRAEELPGEAVVVTFHPHPRQVLAENNQPVLLLTGLEEKISLIEKSGIEHLILINFDRDLSMMNAAGFIEKILAGKIGTRHLLVGFNHHFGRMAASDFQTIRMMANNYKISCEILEPVKSGSSAISSSGIRKALLEGRLEKANDLLGYDYFMHGIIVEGKKIGRQLGYPTANIRPACPDKLIPRDGVYAVEIILNDKKYPGVMSIGFNPTVNEKPEKRTIEVNILGFEGDIYGEKICVTFRYRLRDEIIFRNIYELAKQIEADRQKALKLLGGK
jgi:riboflavin kinase/FMN adenylyltransferase